MSTPARRSTYAASTEGRSRGLPLGTAATSMAILTGLLWLLEIVDQATGNALDAYGIRPRSEAGLGEILTAPWLHHGWGHLISNTVPFFVLGLLILLGGWRRWAVVTAASVLASGGLVWLISPAHSITLGASGVVFGWLVFVLVRGFFSRRWQELGLGVLVFLLYGGVLLGVLPGADGVSWQGHLGGALGGLGAARLLGRRPTPPARSPHR